MAELSRRVEWDAGESCFALRYVSPIGGRLRCEQAVGKQNPGVAAGLVLGLPLVAGFMAVSRLCSSAARPNRLRVFPWGVRDQTPEMSGEVRWGEFQSLQSAGGDLILRRAGSTPSTVAYLYFCRAVFADADEARFCEELLRDLWQSNGAAWDAARMRLLARETVRESLG